MYSQLYIKSTLTEVLLYFCIKMAHLLRAVIHLNIVSTFSINILNLVYGRFVKK